MTNDRLNEKKYVQRIIEGEEYAFKKVFLRYYEPLCNFCWRYVKSKAISEDLVQEVFANLWKLRNTLDPNRSISVYLFQAVKNKAQDYLDHQEVIRRYETDHRHDKEGFTTQTKIRQEDEEFIKAAREAIDNLPCRSQQVYILHREEGLTYREIAEVMEISVKTVESQMSRALDMLRAQLYDKYPDQVTEETYTKIFSIRSTGTE